MAGRERQDLAELDQRTTASSFASTSSPRAERVTFMPARSVPYGLYNRPTGSPRRSDPLLEAALASGFGSPVRLTLSKGKDQSVENPRTTTMHRNMASLNKVFIMKLATATHTTVGDPGCSLVPISLNYVKQTMQLILKHEEDDSSQNLRHLLDDIDSAINKLSKEAVAIRTRQCLLHRMETEEKEITAIATTPSTASIGAAVVEESTTKWQTPVTTGKPPLSPRSCSKELAVRFEDKWPSTPSPVKGSANDSDPKKRVRAPSDADVAVELEKTCFRNPLALLSKSGTVAPLSVGTGTPSGQVKLALAQKTLNRSTSFTSRSPSPSAPIRAFPIPSTQAAGVFGEVSPATTTEKNNNLIKASSTTSLTNTKVPSTPLVMPPPISTSTPFAEMQSNTELTNAQKFTFNAPFGSGLFTNPAVAPVNHVATKEDEDDDEDSAPPVNEFKPVEETDVIYETRVKVFERAGTNYKELGLGKLYVKDHSKGLHLFVRAENNLGTLLINMILTDKIPLTKKTNNVVTVDPLGNNGKGTTYLIRVKTEDAANALMETLEDLKTKKRINNNNNSTSAS